MPLPSNENCATDSTWPPDSADGGQGRPLFESSSAGSERVDKTGDKSDKGVSQPVQLQHSQPGSSQPRISEFFRIETSNLTQT
jgi:hypothetical protein